MKQYKRTNLNQNSNPRLIILIILFVFLVFILIQRLYVLQIVKSTEYDDSIELKIMKERTVKSVRGNIYDRNGALLAGNELVYNITLEDNGDYKTAREKQLTLNSIAYKIIKVVGKNDERINNDLPISLDANNNYYFSIEGTLLNRFRADVYGKAKVDEMTVEQSNASAKDIMEYLCSDTNFALYKEKGKNYTPEELEKYQLKSEYSKGNILDIIGIRYMLSLNTFQRYLPITVATDVSDETVASILENSKDLQGVDIAQDYVRKYEGGTAFAHIIGYTGKISSEELEDLKQENIKYTQSSVVGKAGIEQYMENTLQGTDGTEVLYVNNVGKVLTKKVESVEAVSGNNVYLSIDKDLQIATYKILEQQIAGILTANIVNSNKFDTEAVKDASEIKIPITDVYFALINNNVIDIDHFKASDAGDMEKIIYNKMQKKHTEVLDRVQEELLEGTAPYKALDKEMQDYEHYIVNDLMPNKLGLILETNMDKADLTYKAWKEGTISLRELITYAIKENWIDLSKIPSSIKYMDSEEAYEVVVNEIIKQLQSDTKFIKKLYQYMLRQERISGNEICKVLCEQGVLSNLDSDYQELLQGTISSYEYIKMKINKLEITPAQLALDPCSGSVVIVQPSTGEVLACVTYPGYDNNRLANNLDAAYYNSLLNDLSLPLYNRATQQETAPGSTFKPITAIAGLQEGVISSETKIYCDGVFDKLQPVLHCWNRMGHGEITSVSDALKNSCNDYFCETAYRLGLTGANKYSEPKSLKNLQKYAKLFDLDKKSGIELTESEPHITDQYAIPSAIGQGTHNYTTTQLARYVTALANAGTSYQLSILDKVTSQGGELVEAYTPEIESEITLPYSVWEDVRSGMKQVVENNKAFADLKISAAGKTGTAQEVRNRPDHGLFIGYAPVNNPEISIAVRIANGYSSGNAASVAKNIFDYYFKLEDKSTIITGTASQAFSNSHID
jgi:penicillin-binding protein 2